MFTTYINKYLFTSRSCSSSSVAKNKEVIFLTIIFINCPVSLTSCSNLVLSFHITDIVDTATGNY